MTVESAVGSLLRNVRAGERRLAWNDGRLASRLTFSLTSPAFADGDLMPARYAGKEIGENISPPVQWTGVPFGAADMALIVQDPDAPLPRPVTHLIAYGLDPISGGEREGAFDADKDGLILLGRGSFGRVGYQGPRPVSGHGPHRYVFQMFALSHRLEFDRRPDIEAIVSAMAGRVLARGRLIGRFERP